MQRHCVRLLPARGFTLVEVLVAVAVLLAGIAALMRLQPALHASAAAARQRAQAVRLAQEQVERQRLFTLRDAAPALTPIQTDQPADDTVFRIATRVVPQTAPPYRSVFVAVDWTDRNGVEQHAALASAIDAATTLPSGGPWLQRFAAAAAATPPSPVTIAPGAVRLDEQRSALKPAPNASVAWVFDSTSGAITAVCSVASALAPAALSASQLSNCVARVGWSVSGFVRFATATTLQPDARRPQGPALNLDLCLSAADAPLCNGPALGECFDDAPATASNSQDSVAFHCAVFAPAHATGWSGRLNLVPLGWSIADASHGTDGFKVCRYSFDRNANGRIDAPEHPSHYDDVATPLFDQNFLIVHSTSACPADPSAASDTAEADNPVNHTTVQHQP